MFVTYSGEACGWSSVVQDTCIAWYHHKIKPIIFVPLHILVILLPKYKRNMFVRIASIVMMHVVSVTRIIIVVQEEICTKNEIV